MYTVKLKVEDLMLKPFPLYPLLYHVYLFFPSKFNTFKQFWVHWIQTTHNTYMFSRAAQFALEFTHIWVSVEKVI